MKNILLTAFSISSLPTFRAKTTKSENVMCVQMAGFISKSSFIIQ